MDKCPKCGAKQSLRSAFGCIWFDCGSYEHKGVLSQSDDCRIAKLEAEVQRLREAGRELEQRVLHLSVYGSEHDQFHADAARRRWQEVEPR